MKTLLDINSPEVIAEVERKVMLFNKYADEISDIKLTGQAFVRAIKTKLVYFINEYNNQ